MHGLDARGAGAYRHPSQVGEARPRAHGLQIQALAGLRPCLAIVLEGGYDLDGLTDCARYFAEGFSR